MWGAAQLLWAAREGTSERVALQRRERDVQAPKSSGGPPGSAHPRAAGAALQQGQGASVDSEGQGPGQVGAARGRLGLRLVFCALFCSLFMRAGVILKCGCASIGIVAVCV